MGRTKRGQRDGTGMFEDSYARLSGQGGKRERCYEEEKPKERRKLI